MNCARFKFPKSIVLSNEEKIIVADSLIPTNKSRPTVLLTLNTDSRFLLFTTNLQFVWKKREPCSDLQKTDNCLIIYSRYRFLKMNRQHFARKLIETSSGGRKILLTKYSK